MSTTARGRPSTDLGPEAEHHALTRRLGELARELEAQQGRTSTVEAVVGSAVTDIPGVEDASVSVVVRKGRGHQARSLASTSALAVAVDQVQYDVGQGPCLETLYDHITVRVPDLRNEPRWPRFSRRAADLGIRSMLSVQLFTDGEDLGALNLFSTQVDAFTDESERTALAFSAHAAVAVAAAYEIETLTVAVDSRDLIGQAKGILMLRHSVTASTAFKVLVRHSRDTNVRLVDVARAVVADLGSGRT
jgi:GAF domain-containing protein